jgi:hypothetical protein
MGYRAIVLGLSAALCASATAKLNEFSVADGYQNPFSTPVWTYNPMWTFDGGTLGGNYVAQHGYGAGFPNGEPFALVIRNDNPSSAFQFSYAFEAFDLGGASPGAVGGQTVQIAWDMNGYFGTGATATAPMLVMGFGGTRSNPRMRMGFSNQNKIMYSDAANNLVESTYVMNSGWWSRVALTMNFATSTYDLSVTTMTGNGMLASNTWTPLVTTNIVTGAPFFTPGGTLSNLWFDANVEPSNGAGLSKNMFDHFSGTVIPAPGALGLLAAGGLALGRRRRVC